MAASSSCSQKCDVFLSFRGEDVRSGFLFHLRMSFIRNGLIDIINVNGIERSCEMGLELLSEIREARISIVIFSKNYASSKLCLDELAEIHNCYKELNQKVIPIFYNVDPLEVGKQNGEFGESFMKTCEGKSDDEKQKWEQALTHVANLAGEHLQNWSDEANMVKKIAKDVLNNLCSPSNGFDYLVGIEDHIEEMNLLLGWRYEDPVIAGIWGQSGIGKSTLGRALFSLLSPKFPFCAFVTYKRTDQDVLGTKLYWEKQLLDEILDENIEVNQLGMVKEMLKDKKVLIVLDDVASMEFLETLVGETKWFGRGSRIIVITQHMHLLRARRIDRLYEVKIPAHGIARKMLCRFAFAQDFPPYYFKELDEVLKAVGNLPLGLRVFGYNLRGRKTEEWKELLPALKNGLVGDIMNTFKVCYDRLNEKEQDIFLWIACLFNGESTKSINNFFGDCDAGQRLAEKSLIRISNEGIVEMHILLEKFGREIDHAKSQCNPLGKRRFLTDVEEILDIFTNQTGTGTLLGIFFNASLPSKPFYSIGEKSFEGMISLQVLIMRNPSLLWAEPIFRLPNGLVYLPPKLKYINWNYYPLKHLPFNFKAEFLVELRMEYSELEKLWEGTQELGSLTTIIMSGSIYLKEIPNLSRAINLEKVDFSGCHKLESFTIPLNLECLEYLNLIGCPRLENFPQIKMESLPHGIEIIIQDCLWNKNLPGPDYLDCLRRCYPLKFLPGYLVHLEVKGSTMEKLCEGVQSLGSLQTMNLSKSENLKEIPDLSKATNLKGLDLSNCKSLAMLPSTIGNLQILERLEMKKCIRLEGLPVDVNLSSLKTLNLNGCSSLKSFPQISHSIEELHLDHTSIEEVPCCIKMFPRLIELSMRGCSKLTSFPQLSPSIEKLYLDDTAIEEVPCYIEMFRRLAQLSMRGCNELKNISPNIFRLENLKKVDFTDCGGVVTVLNDSTVVVTIEDPYDNIEKGNTVDKEKYEYEYNHLYFHFQNCFKLDRDARELIIKSSVKWTMILPGGEVPTYFKNRAYGNSLTVTLPRSSPSHNLLRFNVCVVVERLATFCLPVYLHFCFSDVFYKHKIYLDATQMWKTDHLVLFSFKLQLTGLPAILDIKDVEFKFQDLGNWRIKEFGIRLLNESPSPDDRDGRSSETEYQMVHTSILSIGDREWMDLSKSENLKEIPDLSKATNLKGLDLSDCKSLVTLSATIGNLQKLERLEMKKCTRLEVLPVDVNLSSLKTLNLNGCSSLKSFPQISRSIEELHLDHTAIEEVPCCIIMLPKLVELSMRGCSKLTSFPQLSPSIEKLYLDDTAIVEVPCCIEKFCRLAQLSMRGCNELKNISPNIFRLENLKKVDFTDCGGVVTVLNDSTMVATIEDPYDNIEKGNTVDKDKDEYEYNHWYFHFQNCLQLDRDARELIIQSSVKWTMILPGREVPTYFNHRAYGNSLTVALPSGSLFEDFLRVNVCVVVEWLTNSFLPVYLHVRFNDGIYKHKIYLGKTHMWKTDHLVLFSFKFQPTGPPPIWDFNDVEFKFEAVGNRGIKLFGIRLLNVSPSPDDRDGVGTDFYHGIFGF